MKHVFIPLPLHNLWACESVCHSPSQNCLRSPHSSPASETVATSHTAVPCLKLQTQMIIKHANIFYSVLCSKHNLNFIFEVLHTSRLPIIYLVLGHITKISSQVKKKQIEHSVVPSYRYMINIHIGSCM